MAWTVPWLLVIFGCVIAQDSIENNSDTPTETAQFLTESFGNETVFDVINGSITPDEINAPDSSVGSIPTSTSVFTTGRTTTTKQAGEKDTTASTEGATTETPPESTTETMTTMMTPEMEIVKTWENMEVNLKKMIDQLLKMAMPTFVRQSSSISVSKDCFSSLFKLIMGIQQMKPWAFYMLDATAKPLAGTLAGSISSFGSYDECLEIEVRHDRTKKFQFRGQYCAMEIHLPLPPKPRYYRLQHTLDVFANFSTKKDTIMRDLSKISHLFYSLPIRMDLCIPSTCSVKDVRDVIGGMTSDYNIKADVLRCEIKKEWKAENYQIAIFCVFGVLFVLVTIGSLLETIYLYAGNKPRDYIHKNVVSKFLLAFSMYSNTRTLFNTNVTEEKLSVLHGIRAFTMMWMIYANVYFTTERMCFSTLREMTKFPDNELLQVLINFSLSADNLFFISGAVIAYMNLRSIEKYENQFNVFSFVLRRLWRSVPSFMAVIGLSLLLPMFGSGPLWNDVMGAHEKNCKENWWTNLLLVNNFVTKPEESCFTYSSYYAVDLQLYLLSTLVFVPLFVYKSTKLAASINVSFIIGSIISTSLVTYHYGLPPTMLFTYLDPQDLNEVKHIIFHKPYCHMGAFFVGTAIGWFLYKNRDAKMKVSHQIIGWPTTIICSMAILFGVYEWNRGNVPNDSVAALYAGVHRTAWAITLAWFTAVCFYGQGGFLRKVFTWKALVPISRMTIVCYLVQYFALLIISGYLRERIQPNHTIAFFLACGLYLISYLVSYGFYILFDGPIESLKKLIFDSSKDDYKSNVCFVTQDQIMSDENKKSYGLYRVNDNC